MFSAAPTLSKPRAMASSGSISFTRTSTANKSRTVFSYSTRLSRRSTTRPALRCFAAASSSRADNSRTNVCACAASGRGSFFGGISPACTRATISRQRSNVLGLEKSVSNSSSRRSPFAFSGPWQRRQCSLKNAAVGASTAVTAAAVAGVAPEESNANENAALTAKSATRARKKYFVPSNIAAFDAVRARFT